MRNINCSELELRTTDVMPHASLANDLSPYGTLETLSHKGHHTQHSVTRRE